MNYIDVYYRALIDYRKNTLESRDCIAQRALTVKANAKGDGITVIRKICTVNTDWVDAIEKGLVHVEKALREERQFIRSNGEIIDIEKVKNVSKDSVEHLARHSNLITTYEGGEDIVPDRLYTVERLSDYAVYENRFLYMLLCYLRDFITIRYNKILDLEHTYNGTMTMAKTIAMTKRSLTVDIRLSEEKKDDIYLKKQSESKEIIVRIGDLLKLVLAFLATPLMQEVGKVAMIKPPITKTNVLRMNHNFRGALALYEYVSAYEGAGYTVEEREIKQSPFRPDVGDEMAELVMLASFLTYEHGLGLREELRVEYEAEEARRREEEKRRYEEKIKALRHRIKESGMDAEEYMLMLEKHNRMLKEDSDKLVIALKEIEELKGQVATLNTIKAELTGRVEELNSEIEELRQDYEGQIRKLNEEFTLTLQEKTREHNDIIEALKAKHQGEIVSICADYNSKITTLNEKIDSEARRHENELVQLEDAHRSELDKIVNEWQERENALLEKAKNRDIEYSQLQESRDKILNDYRITEARLIAMRREQGLGENGKDYTSKEAFMELEHQLDVFYAFVSEEWKRTKREIRKKALADFIDSIRGEKRKKPGKEKKRKLLEDTEKKEVDITTDTTTDTVVDTTTDTSTDTVVDTTTDTTTDTVIDIDTTVDIDTVIDTDTVVDYTTEGGDTLDTIGETDTEKKEEREGSI